MAKRKNKKNRAGSKNVKPTTPQMVFQPPTAEELGQKIRVLAYCDTPSCATGFGTVSRNIFEGLYRTGRYEIDVLGINYWGNPHPFPYRIWPTGTNPEQDPYGRKKICRMIPKMEYDLLFFLQDTFIMDFLPELIPHLKMQNRKYKSVCFSGDTDILTRDGIKNIKDVKVGDVALSFDTKTGKTLFKKITNVYNTYFEGEMIGINGESVDLVLTPDHNMFMKRCTSTSSIYEWTTIEDMYNRANTVREEFPVFVGVSDNTNLKMDRFCLYKNISHDCLVVIKPTEDRCCDFRKKVDVLDIFSGNKKLTSNGKKISVEYDHHINGYKIPISRFIDNKIDLLEFSNKYKCSVYLKCRHSDRSLLPLTIDIDNFLKLSAWYITEGCCSFYRSSLGAKIFNEISIASSVEKGREINYREYIRKLLNNIGINYREKEKDFLLKGTHLTNLFKNYFGNGAKNKKFPDWFFDLGVKHLRVFFDELLKGDGAKDKKTYTTKSKILAKQIVLLAFMLGIKAHYNYNNERRIYIISFTYSDSQKFPGSICKNNFFKKYHDGAVYCLTVEDTHTVFAGRNGYFSIVGQCYYPIDGVPKEQWIKNISAVDYPVAYCEFGREMSKKAYPDCPELSVIPHGVNTREYFPHPEEEVKSFRQRYFGPQSDKFVFTNLNRNQQRKDIPRTIAAFKEFHKQVPNSLLYLHMAKQDQGWNLMEVCKSFGLSTTEDVIFPENFGPNQGYPREIVNMIYNISDCVVSSSLGEGYGLAWIEGMAAKTPILVPNNTAFTEFVTEDRGYLIDSGTNPSLHTILGNDNEVIRPLVDVDDMVKKMLHIYNNYEEAKQKAENAYRWVNMTMDWQRNIAPQWVAIFDKAYKDLEAERESRPEEDLNGENEEIIEAEEI